MKLLRQIKEIFGVKNDDIRYTITIQEYQRLKQIYQLNPQNREETLLKDITKCLSLPTELTTKNLTIDLKGE